MMIIAFILVGALVYYTFNTNNNRQGSNNNSQNNNIPHNFSIANNPLDILNERFAKGEIEEEEYLKKKAILNQ